jgi:prepilin-type N-terminal cleavage/methylation domain-containing protein
MQKGFTLTELLVVIAILGIISAVGIPQYQGYSATAQSTIAKNNLRSMYMQQQEYFVNNNVYYATGSTCSTNATAINTNLFSGKTILADATEGYTYCITQATTTQFLAQAINTDTSAAFTLNEDNTKNF